MKYFVLLCLLFTSIQLRAQTTDTKAILLEAPTGDLIHFANSVEVLTFSRDAFIAALPHSPELEQLIKTGLFLPAGDTISQFEANRFFRKCFPEDDQALGKVFETGLLTSKVTIHYVLNSEYYSQVFLSHDLFGIVISVDAEGEHVVYRSMPVLRFVNISDPIF